MSVQHNLKKVINASGRMSILGVSNLSTNVLDAMKTGAQNYFIMQQLHEEAGKIVANHVKTEAAYIVNSASAGIALAVAGVITRGDKAKEKAILHREKSFPREILLMKGHNVNYGAPVGTMIELGGGNITEVGYANGCPIEEMEVAISPETVGIVFVQSHHCVQKDMPSIKEVYEIAQKYDIPFIVDAAAEEEIDQFSTIADIVIFSGSKALEGPTSGILTGKEKFVAYAKGHHYGIGRSMKIGKESIFGLLQALEDYQPEGLSKEVQLRRLAVIEQLNDIPGVTVTITQDEAGREIYRARITIDSTKAKMNASTLVTTLKTGDIAIYTRDYNANNGFFDIDPRPLLDTDPDVIVQCIKNVLI